MNPKYFMNVQFSLYHTVVNYNYIFFPCVQNISEFCSAARTRLGSAISVDPVASVSTPDAYKHNVSRDNHIDGFTSITL